MHVNEWGIGTPVVLLHSAPSPASDFAPLVNALMQTHRVLVPDLPGYGLSPRLSPYTLDGAHARVEDALLARGVTSAVFVGFGIGAYRAIALAVRRRIQPIAVISLAGGAGLYPEERAAVRPLVEALRIHPLDPMIRQLHRADVLSPSFAAKNPEAVDRVGRWFDLAAGEVLADEAEAGCDAPDLHAAFGALDLPVLARVGEHDRISPPYRSERLARACRRSTLQVVRGAGHALLVEDPEATVEAITRWMGA